jgi:N utilization substance protein B
VLQELYALHKADNPSIAQFEKELFKSVDQTYDLYRMLLVLLFEIQEFAEQKIEQAKAKKVPTLEDLHPNTKFVDNKVLQSLRKNQNLLTFVKESKFSWNKHPDVLKAVFNEIKDSDTYQSYLKSSDRSFTEDKNFVSRILDEIVLNNDSLYQWLEDNSIFWNDDIGYAGTMANKTIARMKEQDSLYMPLLPKFKNEEDLDFVRTLFRKTAVNATEHNNLVQSYVDNWDVDRIAFMDILIMRIAITEMIEFPSIPIKVTLNEFLEISKEYSTIKSSIFINGILDKIIVKLKAEKVIIKSGRGLIGENNEELEDEENEE